MAATKNFLSNLSVRKLYQLVLDFFRASLIQNASYLVGIEVINSFTGFIFWFLAARFFTPEQIGITSALISAVSILVLIAELGVGNSIVRFLPSAPNSNNFLKPIFTLNSFLLLFLCGLFLYGLNYWSPSLLFIKNNVGFILIFGIYAWSMSFSTIIRMVYLARKKAVFMFLQALLSNVIRLILLVLLTGFSLYGLLGANILGVVFSLAISLVIFFPRVETRLKLNEGFKFSEVLNILPYSLGNYFSGIFSQLPQRLLPLLIVEKLGPASGGYAQISWLIGSFLATPGIALAGSAFAESANSPRKTNYYLIKAAIVGLSVTLVFSITVILFGYSLLELIGPVYADEGFQLLKWLAFAAPFVILTWLYFTYIRIHKRMLTMIILSGLLAFSTITCALLFIDRYGISAYGVGWFIGHFVVASYGIKEAVNRGIIEKTRLLFTKNM